MTAAARMSSDHIFVPLLDLWRSVETDYAIKPTFHQTEPLIVESVLRIVQPPVHYWIERCVSWRDDSDAARCSATNLGNRVDMGELATTSSLSAYKVRQRIGITRY